MIIDFDKLPSTSIYEFKGGYGSFECEAFADESKRIMRGHLRPGCSIGFHTHEETSEILFVFQGEGTVIEDGEEKPIARGMCNFCPKGKAHSLVNSGSEDLIFFAVVANE